MKRIPFSSNMVITVESEHANLFLQPDAIILVP